MIKNVKCLYFIQKFFLFIDEGQKLKLIKYNKSLQKINNIDIINYKLFNGKYIIYDSNSIGKEYDSNNDTLIYEGEYLNGQKNGKGKEYDCNNDLLFEGEYLNGKKLIGIIYDKNRNIIYKINYTNGEGKEYNIYRRIIFEGEHLNGKRHGKGKEYYCKYH